MRIQLLDQSLSSASARLLSSTSTMSQVVRRKRRLGQHLHGNMLGADKEVVPPCPSGQHGAGSVVIPPDFGHHGLRASGVSELLRDCSVAIQACNNSEQPSTSVRGRKAFAFMADWLLEVLLKRKSACLPITDAKASLTFFKEELTTLLKSTRSHESRAFVSELVTFASLLDGLSWLVPHYSSLLPCLDTLS